MANKKQKQDCENRGGKWVEGQCDLLFDPATSKRARASTSKRKRSAKITTTGRRGRKRGGQRDWYPEK